MYIHTTWFLVVSSKRLLSEMVTKVKKHQHGNISSGWHVNYLKKKRPILLSKIYSHQMVLTNSSKIPLESQVNQKLDWRDPHKQSPACSTYKRFTLENQRSWLRRLREKNQLHEISTLDRYMQKLFKVRPLKSCKRHRKYKLGTFVFFKWRKHVLVLP